MAGPKTKDEFRARLYRVCQYLEKEGIVPEGSCERLQALPPTLLPAPVPGVPPPAAPPATFTPQAPEPGRFDPTEPGAAQIPVAPTPPAGLDPATLLPAAQLPTEPRADQLPTGPGADQLPTEPEPQEPGVAPPPGLPLTGPQLPTPQSGKGSILVYPQLRPQSTSGAGYFTGVRPGTYAYPSSIQVDGKGRIVSIVPGSAPETSDLCLTSYLVSTNEDGAPYTEIQEAYDAAVAAGHGIDNPAQVLVCPGDYTEDLQLTTAGIDVIAVAPDKRQPAKAGTDTGRGLTRVLGQVDIQLAAESTRDRTTMAWRGIDVERIGAGAAFIVQGPAVSQYVYVSDCKIKSTGNIAMAFEGPGSILDVQRCELVTDSVAAVAHNHDSGTSYFFACALTGANAAGASSVLATDGLITLEQCTLRDRILVDTAEVALIDSSISANGSGVISGANPAALTSIIRSRVEGVAGQFLFDGVGNIFHDAMTFGANGPVLGWNAAAVTVQSIEGMPQEQFMRQVLAATTVTTQTAMSARGPTTVTLPPIGDRPGPVFIKHDSTSVGAVTVSAQAGETIRVGTAAPALTITVPEPTGWSTGGVILIANTGSGWWEAFFLGSEPSPCPTSYTVGTATDRAEYTSIQAAYDAAKADGHDESDPAKILVCPGIYTEDIGMDQAGIDIIAIAQDPYNELRGAVSEGITRLVGNLSIDLDTSPPGIANNTCAWRGIDIDMQSNPGAARQAIIFGGTDPQRAYISDCRIVSRPDSIVVVGSNSGAGSTLDFVRCGIIQPATANGAPPTSIDWDDGTIELTDCAVFHSNTFGELLDLELGAEFFATGCVLTGGFDVAGDVVCRHCNITGAVDLTNASGTMEITSCEMDTAGGAGQLVTGSGEFIYDRLPWTGGTQGTFNTPASGLTTTQLESVPDGAFYDALAAATYNVTTESSMTMNTDGGAQVVNLPPATWRCGPIRIKEIGSAAAGLTATPNGTDTINRGAAGVGVVVPVTGYTFVSDGISNWEIFA